MLKESCVLFLLLAGVAFAGTKALAQELDTVYQLRSDGTIRSNTCSGISCQGAVLLDDNPEASFITAGGSVIPPGNTVPPGYKGWLVQMHNNGSIWQYTGTPCNGSSCPGWVELYQNPGTAMIAAGNYPTLNPHVWRLDFSGELFEVTGGLPAPVLLDSNSITQIAVAGGTEPNCVPSCPATPNTPPLVQLHSDGNIWQYTGTPCDATSCPGWQHLDNNPAAVKIFGYPSGNGGAFAIFQLHSNGSIWRYTGQPCNGSSCPGWTHIADAPSAKIIMTADISARLFVMNTDGSIWELPDASEPSPQWVELDNSPLNVSIAASFSGLFRLQSDGSIFYFDASNSTGSSHWVLVDSNRAVTAITASSLIH